MTRVSGQYIDLPNMGPLVPERDVHALTEAKPRYPLVEKFLFQYKSMQSPVGKLPLRQDISLAQLVAHLNMVLLLDLEPGWQDDSSKIFCRVAGTGLRDIFGCELTGRPFSEMAFKGLLARWHDLVRFAAKDAAGAWGEGAIAGLASADGADERVVMGEYMFLPLSHDGLDVNQMLAYVQIEDMEES